MDIKEFMERTNVSKMKYVEKWIEMKYIPGVTRDKKTGEWVFPESARRPYKPRHKVTADAMTIRASMVNACIKRCHISKEIFKMSQGEFEAYVKELVVAGLIRIRTENGIIYYDSTIKSNEYKGKSFRFIKKNVINCIGEVVGSISYGAMKALCDN